MTALPEDIDPGDPGHIGHHEALHQTWNRSAKVVPFLRDGSNEQGLWDAYHDDATPGDVLILPPGDIKLDTFDLSKQLHVIGAGRFNTRLICDDAGLTGPFCTIDRTIDSGGGIWRNYGPIVEGVGLDISGSAGATGIETTPNAAWLKLRDVLVSGGTDGIDHHAPNATFDDVFIWDCSGDYLTLDEDGLELRLAKLTMSANVVSGACFIRVAIVSGGGLKGAIYFGNVTGNTAGGMITMDNGLVMTAPSLTEVPTFTDGSLVLDNINGGGPVVDLDHVQSVSLKGWANGTDGCIRMDGCVGIDVAMRTRGGTHTFEFVGDETVGFKSRSEVFTGPAYKFTGTPPDPDGWDVDDWIAGATDLGRRSWRTLRLQGMFRQREDGDSPPQGFGTMVAGVLLVTHPNVQTNTRIDFWRETTGATGTPGILIHDVANNVVGTSFSILSTSATDTGRIGWRFHGDAD